MAFFNIHMAFAGGFPFLVAFACSHTWKVEDKNHPGETEKYSNAYISRKTFEDKEPWLRKLRNVALNLRLEKTVNKYG